LNILASFLFKIIIPNLISVKRGLQIVKPVTIKGFPIVQIGGNAAIIIGPNVVINSINRGYHINMHSPVKLMAESSGAVIAIGENTRIHGTCIHAYGAKISIGKNCLIAANTQIFDSNGHELSFPDVQNRINTKDIPKSIIIEDNVWIGAHCLITPGVRIGNGSVIAAGSIVTKDIPSNVIAGGNPAKVIKEYFTSMDN
jgi:acetyltransferase-like isoleucine patch superfamily enzyme